MGKVRKAFDKAVESMGLHGSVSAGTLIQKFDCGLCQLLTMNDFGPVECRQPDHNENTCPDIEEYRTS